MKHLKESGASFRKKKKAREELNKHKGTILKFVSSFNSNSARSANGNLENSGELHPPNDVEEEAISLISLQKCEEAIDRGAIEVDADEAASDILVPNQQFAKWCRHLARSPRLQFEDQKNIKIKKVPLVPRPEHQKLEIVQSK